jgi:hypothetical protein
MIKIVFKKLKLSSRTLFKIKNHVFNLLLNAEHAISL